MATARVGFGHDHAATRAALAGSAARIAALVASQTDGTRRLLRSEWTVADVAAHLVIGFRGYTDAALGRAEHWQAHIIEGAAFPDRVRAFNQRSLAEAARLDPGAGAVAIVEAARGFLEETGGLDPAAPVAMPWYGDAASVSVAAATSLLLGEQLMHGRDLARTVGRPWPITRPDALLVLEAFRAMVSIALNPATAGDLTAAYELRVKPGARFVVRVTGGRATVEESAGQAVDCRVAADPVALLLVGYGRMTQWQAIARGQLVAWGRRPWLGSRFAGLFYAP
jgi:hypothetical protein